jgi:hypothetical protein
MNTFQSREGQLTREQKTELENQAMALLAEGLTTKEIEEKLGHEFIFMQEVFGRKIVSCNYWKAITAYDKRIEQAKLEGKTQV